MKTPEVLCTRNINEDTLRHKLFCVDLLNGRNFDLSLSNEPRPGNPLLLPKTNEMLYVNTAGIATYNFSLHEERLLLPIDSDSKWIQRMWLSPKDSRTLYYIQRTDHPLPPVTYEELMTQKEVCQVVVADYELCRWQIQSGSADSVVKFANPAVSADIDWNKQRLFAFLGNSKELVSVDLANHQLTSLGKQDGGVGLVISPRNTLVTWSLLSPRIEETLSDDRKITLVPFGGYPAFSPNGLQMAFTQDHKELWLMEENGNVEMVIASPTSETQLIDTPSWCLCNDHVAARLTEGKDERRILVVVDTRRRDVLLIKGLSALSGVDERIWLPQSVVMSNRSGQER